MKCWACSGSIELSDPVKELPIVRALVHRACYERETGDVVTIAHPLQHYVTGQTRLPAAA